LYAASAKIGLGYEAVRNGMVQAASNTLVMGLGRGEESWHCPTSDIGQMARHKERSGDRGGSNDRSGQLAYLAEQSEFSRKSTREVAARINL
jgi:hypothetical protein